MKVYPGNYQGNIVIPASKSDAQRAILCAGLAKGESIFLGVGDSLDEMAMLENIKALGAEIIQDEEGLKIKGMIRFPEELHLNLGESGLGARLMSSLCLVHPGSFKITGEGTLLNRPLTFFNDYFKNKIPFFSDTNGHLPIHMQGGFPGGELTVSGKLSSQYISGLLMALPLAKEDSIVHVEDLNSKPYVQMTLNTLLQFGIAVDHKNLSEFVIRGNQKYLSNTYKVEGDWSSGAYWLIASALGQKISVSGLSMSSLQADKLVLKALTKANCMVENRKDRLFVDGTERKSFDFDLTDAPDLFPTLAALAALTEGVSRLKGLNRLIYKESNRAITIQSEFKKLNITIELDEHNDEMVIYGQKSIFGGKVFSNNDHRIAMSLAILAMMADNPVEIENPMAVAKSYPSFWEDLKSLEQEV